MSLIIENLSVEAGDFTLSEISLSIPEGKCAVLMGRSGSGKTTLMEALCGLRQVSSGSIMLGGMAIQSLRPAERGIGLVPQDAALFPHLTVREHLSFGPSLNRWKKSRIAARVESLASMLGLDHLLERKPQGLSGGEAKRVALGRAIAVHPKLLCLDESLNGLDRETHDTIMELLLRIIREERLTTLHITHREDEAQAIGDLVYKISANAHGQSQLRVLP